MGLFDDMKDLADKHADKVEDADRRRDVVDARLPEQGLDPAEAPVEQQDDGRRPRTDEQCPPWDPATPRPHQGQGDHPGHDLEHTGRPQDGDEVRIVALPPDRNGLGGDAQPATERPKKLMAANTKAQPHAA